MIKVEVADGKYAVLLPEDADDHASFRALRHGEEWRDLVGDNLVYSLASELHVARKELEAARIDQRTLAALHAGGVDNWEWYEASLEGLDD